MRLENKDIEEIVGVSAKSPSGQLGGPATMGESPLGWEEMLERQKVPLIFLTVAVFLVGIGFAIVRGGETRLRQGSGGQGQGVVFETERRDGLIGNRDSYKGPIFVDVAGAVEKPGVYELAAGARVKDALVASGGLAAEADREFVSRSMNLAAPIMDGAKVYIPAVGEVEENARIKESGGDLGLNSGLIESVAFNKININTASSGELEKLKGIGPVRAGEIIDNRPYSSIEELRSKGVLGPKTFDKIKDEISVY